MPTKVLIKHKDYDSYGDSFYTDFDHAPLATAYQDAYVETEKMQVEPTVTHRFPTETLERDGKVYVYRGVDEITNPQIEGWLEEGYDHTFEEAWGNYPHRRVWMYMTRKVEKTGWFTDLAGLEELAYILKDWDVEIYVGKEFNLEDEEMLVLCL